MNIVASKASPGWGMASPGSFIDQPSCVVIVDMVNSTSLWEMIWLVENTISARRDSLKGTSVKRECWNFVSAAQNAIIDSFIYKAKPSCRLVKGMGDGFIFQTDNVIAAYRCAVEAERAVNVLTADPTRLIGLRKLRDELAGKQEEDLATLYRLTAQLLDALLGISFRSIIHWTGNIVHGLLNMTSKRNWRNGTGGLQLAESLPNRKKWILFKPYYPDLFGHDMNYASRCLSVASDSGIYLTQRALKKIQKSNSRNKPKDPVDDIVQISVKGITSQHVAFYKALKDEGQRNKKATVPVYKAKAVVFRDDGVVDVNRVFEKIRKLITGEDKTREFQRLRPHIFSVAVVQRNKMEKNRTQIVFRIEGSDQEYIEKLIVGEFGVNEFIAKGSEIAGQIQTVASIDTETKFIRTNTTKPYGPNDVVRWANKERFYQSSYDYFYGEIQVTVFEDIDKIAVDVIKAADNHTICIAGFELIELCRLWGKPAMYMFFRTSNARMEDIDKHMSAVEKVIEGVFGLSGHKASVTIHRCLNFVTLSLDGGSTESEGKTQATLGAD